MPRKKKVDAEKLLKMIESGAPRKEIMEKLNINTSSQLNSLYLDALVEGGKVRDIVSSRGKARRGGNEITVNKRGSLIIPKDLVSDMGFSEEDLFTVRKTKSGVSLKKI
jgi:hypothetical protein